MSGISGTNSLFYATGIDNSGMAAGARRHNQILSGMTAHSQQEATEMNKIFSRLGAAMATYFSFTTGKDFINDVVRVRGEFQQLDIALTTMLGSKEKADKLMSEVVQLAATTPFRLTDVGQGAKQLLAYRIESEKVIPTLKAMGDVAAGLSVPLDRLILNYGQVKTQTKLTGRELRDFNVAGVPLIAELSKNLKVSEDAISGMVTAGKIGFADVENAFKTMSGEGGQFANLMDKQMASVTGRISNMKDAFDRMLNSIGEANEETIVSVIDGLGSAIENYEEIVRVLKIVAATYGTYKAVLLSVALAQKAAVYAEQVKTYIQLSRAIGLAATNQFVLNRAMLVNPYLAAAAGVAALVGGLVAFNTRKEKTIAVSQSFQKELKKETTQVKEAFKALSSAKEGSDSRTKAIEAINSQYKIYLPNLLSEKSGLDEIKEAQDSVTEAIAKSIAMRAQEDALEKVKEKTAKNAERYTDAVSTFAMKVELDNDAKGRFFADVDKLLDNLSSKTDVSLKEVRRSISDLMIDYGVDVGTFLNDKNVASGNIINELNYSISDYVRARQNETKVVSDLDAVYKSYLTQLGLVNDEEKQTTGGGSETAKFELKEYEKTLDEKAKAYKTYETEAYQLGQKYAKNKYKNLLKEGESYKDFLNQQLQDFANNEAAKTAIAQSAAKNGVNLRAWEELEKLTPKAEDTIDINAQFEINSKTLKSMDAYVQRNKQLAKILGNIMKEEDAIGLANGLMDAGYVMQDLAGFASNFSNELAVAVGAIGDISGGIGNIVSGMAQGGFAGGAQVATGIIGIANSVFQLFDDSAAQQELAVDKANAMLDVLELQNIALERQLRLNSELSGIERQESEEETLRLIQEQLSALDKMADSSELLLKKGRASIDVKFDGGIEELEALLSDLDSFEFGEGLKQLLNLDSIQDAIEGGYDFTNLDELTNMIDRYYELLEQRRELIKEVIDSTESGLTDSLIGGLQNGLTMVQSFADTFEDAMKRAILKSFETTYILPIVNKMIDGVYESMAKAQKDASKYDQGSQQYNTTYASSLDQYTNDFRDSMQGEIDAAQEGMEQMKKIVSDLGFGDLFSSDSATGLAGAIKRELTEETGSMLAGLFNVMSIDVRNIFVLLQESTSNQVSSMQASITLLTSIEVNTRKTADNSEYLEEMNEQLTSMKTTLKDIKNQNSDSTSR